MKSYFIDSKIRFDVSENKLFSLTNQDEIEISLVTSKLFELLLEHKGEVASREKIFMDVFEKFGANCTDNNLNQYILNIRKSLQFLGGDKDIIKTVPKIGFTIPITTDIDVREERHEPMEEEANNKWNGNIFLFVLFTALLSILFVYFLHEYNKQNEIKWDHVKTIQVAFEKEIGSCKFRATSVDDRPYEEYIDGAIDYIESNLQLKCNNTNSIYHIFTNFLNKGSYSYYIIKCHSVQSSPLNCISQYSSIRIKD